MSKFNYNFPSATGYAEKQMDTENTDSKLLLQLDFIEQEVRECRAEVIAGRTRSVLPEALDVAHAAETLIRLFEANYISDIDAAHKAVIKKNKDRGYYATGTDYSDYIEEGR